MLTWAIAYATARGASENWFWAAMPLDFLLGVVMIQTIKDCAKYKYIVTETRKAVEEIQNRINPLVGECND